MIGLNRERGWREGDSRTESLYMPEKKRLRDMTLEELRRGLCLRSDGNENVCRSYRGQCAFGLRALKLVEARGLSDHPLEPLRGRTVDAAAQHEGAEGFQWRKVAFSQRKPVAKRPWNRNQRFRFSRLGKPFGRPAGRNPAMETEARGLSDRPLEPLRGRPSGRNPEPLGTKLTKNQMAHAECMKRQRRNRVAKARALMAAGTPESIAALAAGYGSTNAYRKAEAKCQAEARKEQNRHV